MSILLPVVIMNILNELPGHDRFPSLLRRDRLRGRVQPDVLHSARLSARADRDEAGPLKDLDRSGVSGKRVGDDAPDPGFKKSPRNEGSDKFGRKPATPEAGRDGIADLDGSIGPGRPEKAARPHKRGRLTVGRALHRIPAVPANSPGVLDKSGPEEFDGRPIVLARRPAFRHMRAEERGEPMRRFEFGVEMIDARGDKVKAFGSDREHGVFFRAKNRFEARLCQQPRPRARKGKIFYLREKDSGFKEIVVCRMVWK